jgi:hypothetical protein
VLLLGIVLVLALCERLSRLLEPLLRCILWITRTRGAGAPQAFWQRRVYKHKRRPIIEQVNSRRLPLGRA